MKVSIIIPVYNVAPYINQCLDSVGVQTFHDIECILVDDCGTDNSKEIVQQYIDNYQGLIQFKFIHHDKNQGLSGARNTGIKTATGDFLYFLDSDDAITPDCIETLINLACKHPEADFIQGNILRNNGQNNPYAFNDTIPEFCDDKEQLETLMLHHVITSACNRLIKRSVIVEHHLYFPVGILHEDMYWTYFLSKYVKAAAYTIKGTYIYAVHEGTIMTSVSKDIRMKRLYSRLTAAEIYYQDIRSSSFTSHARRAYLCINLFSCLTELTKLHNFKLWISFWHYAIRLATENVSRATFPRFMFLMVLLPPICFIARKTVLRWRIQQHIISRV